MSKRQASCLQCGQNYDQIPDSVTATHIQCPKCQGVVEIKADAPPLNAKPLGNERPKRERPSRAQKVDRAAVKPEAKPAPVVPTTPRKVAPVVPVKPVIQPPKAAPPRPVAPRTPDKPVPAEPNPEEMMAKKKRAQEIIAKARAKKEQQTKTPAASPATPSSAPAPAKKLSGAELIAQLKKKQTPAQAPAVKKTEPKGTRPTRKNITRRSSRRSEETPKKSPMPMIAGLVLVVGVVGGSAYVLTRGDSPEETNGSNADVATAAPDTPETPVATGPVDLPPAATLLGTAKPEGAIEEQGELQVVAAPPPPEIEEEESPPPRKATSAEFQVPSAGEAVSTRGITDFDALDLAAVPALSRWSSSSDDDWESVQSKLELFLDDSGVRSTRAGDSLVKKGRHAFPAIVNQMMRLDYSTREGNYTAGMLNDLISKIGQGTNFGWKSLQTSTPGSEAFLTEALFNKKIAAKWQGLWVSKFSVDDAQWEGFSKNEKERRADLKEKKQVPVEQDDGEDLFDD